MARKKKKDELLGALNIAQQIVERTTGGAAKAAPITTQAAKPAPPLLGSDPFGVMPKQTVSLMPERRPVVQAAPAANPVQTAGPVREATTPRLKAQRPTPEAPLTVGGLPVRLLRNLQNNSVAWHQTEDAGQRTALEQRNAALRAKAGLLFDPAGGRTYTSEGINLSAPLDLVYGAGEAKAQGKELVDAVRGIHDARELAKPLPSGLLAYSPGQLGEKFARESAEVQRQNAEKKAQMTDQYQALKTRLNSVATDYYEKQKIKEQMHTLEKEYDRISGMNGGLRAAAAVQSISNSVVGMVPALFENLRQRGENEARNQENPELMAKRAEYDALKLQADNLRMSITDYPDELRAMDEQLEKMAAEISAMEDKTPVSPYKFGQRHMRDAQSLAAEATDMPDNTKRFLASTGLSMANNAAMLPTALLHPAAPLALMGTQAAAQKTVEENAKGAEPGASLGRGLIAGGIEAATEKIPIENLLSIVKTGGKGAIRNLFKQAGVEATEEGASYIANYLVDVAAQDPDAEFSLEELLQQSMGGAISGFGMAGAGSLVNYATSAPQRATGRAGNAQAGNVPPRGMNLYEGVSDADMPAVMRTDDADLNARLAGHSPEMQMTMLEYENAVDEGLKDFIDRAKSGKTWKGEKYRLGTISERAAADIQQVTGTDVSGFDTALNVSTVEHVEKRHGAQGIHDSLMSDPEELARMLYVLDKYDSVESTGKTTAAARNSDGSKAPLVIYSKRINGTYYVVEAVPDSAAKTLQIITAYKTKAPAAASAKKEAGQSMRDVSSPALTSDNAATVPASASSISQSGREIKSTDAKSQSLGHDPATQALIDAAQRPATVEPDLGIRYGETPGAPRPQVKAEADVPPVHPDYDQQQRADELAQQQLAAAEGRGDQAFEIGEHVRAMDRNNLGIVQRYHPGDQTYDVFFQDSATGANQLVNLPAEQLQGIIDGRPALTPESIEKAETQQEALQYDETALDEILSLGPVKKKPRVEPGSRDYSRFDGMEGRADGADVKALIDEIDYDTPETVVPDDVALRINCAHGAYGKDLSRVLDQAAGKDHALREQLRDIFERPFWEAKSEYAHNVKTKLDEYYAQMKRLEIKQGSRESAAVMWYGEGQRTLENGDVVQFGEQDLREMFPDKYREIMQADAINRTLYDDSLRRINATLERIYPHVEQQAQQQADKYRARSASLSNAITALDQKASPSMDDRAARARLMDDLKQTDDKLAKLQRDIESGEIFRNKRLRARKDYYHHFQELQEGFAALGNILTSSADIEPHLVGTSDNTKPNTKWEGFMQRRGSNATVEDSVGAMVRYIPAAEFKVNIDPQIARLRVAVRDLMDATGAANTTNANSLIEYLTDFTNDVAGKTNPFDRALQKAFGRKALRVVEWINGRVKSNAILGNLNSATAQWFNLPNAAAYIKNPVDMARGVANYAAYLARDERARKGIAQSGFLTERFLDESTAQFDESLLHKPKEFATWLLTVGDRQAAQVAWFAAYEQGQRKGIANAVEYADDIVRRSVAGRGIGEVPLLQKSKFVKLIAPFQVEVNNAYQLIKERVGQKDALGLAVMFVLTYLMNGIKEELTGNRTGFDPIDAVSDAVEQVQAPEYKGSTFDKVRDVGGRLAGEFVSNMPYGTQIATAFVRDENQRQKLFGDSDPTRFGTGNIGINAITDPIADYVSGRKVDPLEPAANLLLPWGGRQLMRTKTQLEDMGLLPVFRVDKAQGFTIQKRPAAGAYSEDGKQLKFPLDLSNVPSVIKGAVFGRYATDEGKAYIEGGMKALSEKSTAAYDALVKEYGADPETVYSAIEQLSKVGTGRNPMGKKGNTTEAARQAKQELLYNLEGLTPEQKRALDLKLISSSAKSAGRYGSQDEFVISTQVSEGHRPAARQAVASGVSAEQYYKYDEALRVAQHPEGVTDSAAREQVLAQLMGDASLTDGEKNVLVDRVLIASLSDSRQEDWESTYKGVLTAPQFVQLADTYSEIKKQYEDYSKEDGGYSKARMQTTDFYKYVDTLGLDAQTRAAVLDDFWYSQPSSVEPIPYSWDMVGSEDEKKYAGRLEASGLDIAVYNEIKLACKDYEADKDANGKSVSGSKKAKIVNYVRSRDDLTHEQQNLVIQAMGFKLDSGRKSKSLPKLPGLPTFKFPF